MKQLKTMAILSAVSPAIAFTACEKEGPSGSQGEQGLAGTPGETGPRGGTGTDANKIQKS